MKGRQVLFVVALIGIFAAAVALAQNPKLEESQTGGEQVAKLVDYNAPAVAAGQLQAGEVRRSMAGHVKNLASVVGQNGKRMLQEAQPALLNFKSDLVQAKDKIKLSPGVVRAKDALPTRETVRQAAAPILAKGQETIGRLVSGIKERRHRYNTRYHQQQQQQQPEAAQQEPAN